MITHLQRDYGSHRQAQLVGIARMRVRKVMPYIRYRLPQHQAQSGLWRNIELSGCSEKRVDDPWDRSRKLPVHRQASREQQST